MNRTLLNSRNYRAYLTAGVMTGLGTWIQKTALSWFIFQQTGSADSLAYIVVADAAPFLLLSVHAGWLSDRLQNKLTAWRKCYLAQSALFFILAIALYVDPDANYFIYLSVAFSSALQTMQAPLAQLAIRTCFRNEDQAWMASTNAVVNNSSRFIGAWIGTVAFSHLGTQGIIAVNAASFMFPYWIFRQIIPIDPYKRPATSNVSLLGGARYIIAHSRTRHFFMLLFVTCFFGRPIVDQAPAIASYSGRNSIGSAATLIAAVGIGALVAASLLPILTQKWSALRASTGGVVLMAVASLLLAISFATSLSIFAFGLLGFGMVSHGAGMLTFLQQTVPAPYTGRTFAIFNLLLRSVVAVGALALGWMTNNGVLVGGLLLTSAFIGTSVAIFFYVERFRSA